MNENQRTVFSLTVNYLDSIKDLSNLRIAIKDEGDSCLYYGWINFLRNKNCPLVLDNFSVAYYCNEKEFLLKLVKDTLEKAFVKMRDEGRHDPFATLINGLEDCKNALDAYIDKAKGPMPEMYTDEFEEWEGYDDYTRGFDRAVMYEDFWKGGGREGEAISMEYREWMDADHDIKKIWMMVINDTINTIKFGNLNKDNSLNTKAGRKVMLTRALAQHNLQLRSDSVLCQDFINRGSRNIPDIVKVMLEMNFLYSKTDYRSRVVNKSYGTSIEEVKLSTTYAFIENNPERLKEVPSSLIAKVNKAYKREYKC